MTTNRNHGAKRHKRHILSFPRKRESRFEPNQRFPNIIEIKNLGIIRDHLAEASQHHRAAVDAHDAADDRAVARAHRRLGRCLDVAVRACRALSAEGAAKDIENSQSAQTSAGTSTGTSADGRFSHPLMHGDIAGWLGRAFPRTGARR